MAQRKRLGEILVQAGVLTEAQLRAALNEQRRWGGPLGRVLIDMKLLPEDAMVQALSHQLNLPAVALDHRNIDNAVLDLVPGEMAEQHALIPFAAQGKFLDVAMVDPTNLAAIDALRIKTRLNVRPYLAGPKTIERALARHYGRGVGPVEVTGNMMSASQSPPDAAIPTNSPMFDSEPMQLSSSLTPTSAAQTATARRAGQFGLAELAARETQSERTIAALKERIENLEALVARDEDVLRKLLTFLVQKGLATREELMERIK